MPGAAPVSSAIPEEFAYLVASFAAITDSRFARGKVHPLPGVLALVVLGLMAGCRSLSAISRFGQIHPEVLAPLGLRRSPSVATLHRLLRRWPRCTGCCAGLPLPRCARSWPPS